MTQTYSEADLGSDDLSFRGMQQQLETYRGITTGDIRAAVVLDKLPA